MLTLLSASFLFTLKVEAIRSPETLGLTRATWRHISEDDIFLLKECYLGGTNIIYI
jgi:hypothetical protein